MEMILDTHCQSCSFIVYIIYTIQSQLSSSYKKKDTPKLCNYSSLDFTKVFNVFFHYQECKFLYISLKNYRMFKYITLYIHSTSH